MFNETGKGRWKLLGFVPVAVLLIFISTLLLFDLNGPVYAQPYLWLVLQFITVFIVGIILAIVSSRAYLLFGSINVLLIGIAALVFGTLLIIAQLAITPSTGLTLTPNEAVTLGNMGQLLGSAVLFLSAMLLWSGKGNVLPDTSRKIVLGTSYLLVLVVILAVTAICSFGQFPVFFISGTGSTPVREAVLLLSAIFAGASVLLFGWKYLRTGSTVLYWYSLGVILFLLGLTGSFFTVNIGDALNWIGRIGFYLMGVYFLMAVLSRDPNLG